MTEAGNIDWFDEYTFDNFANPVEIKKFSKDGKLTGVTKMNFEIYQVVSSKNYE